jgi:DNA-binding XRE family transcriptional regulator
MSVRTKTPPTDSQCTLIFLGPADQAELARTALQALGFVEAVRQVGSAPHVDSHIRAVLDTNAPALHALRNPPTYEGMLTGIEWTEASAPVPWREAFPPLDDAERPGRMLRAARTREDLTQTQLAQLTGIPQRHLSEMEHGKRAIGKERAKKLAEVLHVNYRMFL